jgi:hypothetical protein
MYLFLPIKAFGIALGDIVSVIFVDVEPDLAWRYDYYRWYEAGTDEKADLKRKFAG